MQPFKPDGLKKSIAITTTFILLTVLSSCSNKTSTTVDASETISAPPSTGALITPPEEITTPRVTFTEPSIGTNHIPVDANLSAGFSTTVALNSIDAEQFTLQHGNNIPTPASITFDGTIAVLDPFEDLLPSTHYQVTLNSGIVGVDGEPLEAYTWDFYTDGNGWAPDETFETSHVGSAASLRLAVDSHGNAIAVWDQLDNAAHQIYTKRYNANTGTWGALEIIDATHLGSATYPEVAVDANDNAIAVWQQHDGTRYNIYANHYDAETASWGSAQVIEHYNGGSAYYPHIASDPDGNAFVAWSHYDGHSYNLFTSRYDASTSTWSTHQEIDGSNRSVYSDDIQVSADTNGNAIVVWGQHDGNRINNYAIHYNANTGTWKNRVVIEHFSAGNTHEPNISMDANGNAIAVWHEHDGTRNNVYSNRYDATTGSWGDAVLLEHDNAGQADYPAIATDFDGNAIAIWEQHDGTRYNIYTNRYDAQAATWSGAELIETNNAGNAAAPQITIDAQGNGIAVWHQGDGTHDNIYTNRFDTSADTWGAAELLETHDLGAAIYPRIAVDAEGYVHALWDQHTGTNDSVHWARFDPHVVDP